MNDRRINLSGYLHPIFSIILMIIWTIIANVLVLVIVADTLADASLSPIINIIVYIIAYSFIHALNMHIRGLGYKYIIVSAKDSCIYSYHANLLLKIKTDSLMLYDIEDYDGEDSVTRKVDEKGKVTVERHYTLTLYGEFGQENYVFGNMQDRTQAINAIEKTIEYIASNDDAERGDDASGK